MILDTNALFAQWEGDPNLMALLAASSQIYVPAPALAEFRFGILQSRKRLEMDHWMTQALNSSIVLTIEDATTNHYATL